MKAIYLLLIRSNTYLSRAIHLVTGDQYTHISISFDPTFTKFYSFGRKWQNLPLPAGFVQEDLNTSSKRVSLDSPCSLYELKVPSTSFDRAKQYLAQMLEEQDGYHYNLLGLLCCAFSIDFERKRHYFCSQFIGEILVRSQMVELPKPPGLMRPIDYTLLKESHCLYSGKFCELSKALIG